MMYLLNVCEENIFTGTVYCSNELLREQVVKLGAGKMRKFRQEQGDKLSKREGTLLRAAQ